MIFAPEGLADILQRVFGEAARDEHGHLTRKSDTGLASLARHISQTNIVMLGHFALHLVDTDRPLGLLLQNVSQDMFNRLVGQRSPAQRGEGGNSEESTLKTTDIGFDPLSQIIEDVTG